MIGLSIRHFNVTHLRSVPKNASQEKLAIRCGRVLHSDCAARMPQRGLGVQGRRCNEDGALLVGSTFPMGLVRRPVTIAPVDIAALRSAASTRRVVSFWGHENTVAAASAVLGCDLRPEVPRPALLLSPEGLPGLNGKVFGECWILSPDYAPGFRPQVGVEPSPGQICGWTALRVVWEDGQTK